jgi:hypothetical protein
MFRRIMRRAGRLPLFRLGAVLVILSQVIEALDALAGLDLASILPAHYSVAAIITAIGLLKIVLRGVFVVASMFQPNPREGPQ